LFLIHEMMMILFLVNRPIARCKSTANPTGLND
jgi:hypothetical protein